MHLPYLRADSLQPTPSACLLKTLFASLLTSLAFSGPVQAQDDQPQPTTEEEVQELKEQLDIYQRRIEDLEDSVFDVTERLGSRAKISAFEAVQLDLGGFLHTAGTYVESDDGSAFSFNQLTAELLIRAELGDKWSAFIAQAFTRNAPIEFQGPNGTGLNVGARTDPTFNHGSSQPLVIAWTNHQHSVAFNVRFGRFVTPHGIINIEHFPALLLDPEQPQFLRPFGSDTLFPNFTQGIQLTGKIFLGDNTLEYHTYTANFTENSDELVTGGRAAYSIGDSGITLGLNLSAGERRDRAGIPADNGGEYTLFGADLLYDKGPFQLKAEYFQTDETDASDREAYYVQPAWRLNDRWTAFYRYDFLDNGNDTGDSVENVLGLNFKPVPAVRLRATYTNRDYDGAPSVDLPSADADIVQVSATVSF